MTPQELIAYIEGLIIDNTTQQVTPYKMRAVLTEIVNSLNQSNISSLSAVLPLQYDAFTNTLSLPVVNNLTTGGTNSVLSAEQGKVLKQLIDDLVISGVGIPEAPIDGTTYGRKDGAWEAVGAGATPTLQQVTDTGANTTNTITIDKEDEEALIFNNLGDIVGNITNASEGAVFSSQSKTTPSTDNIEYRNGKIVIRKGNVTSKTLHIPYTGETDGNTIATREWVNTEISSAVVGLLDDRGNHDASSNTFPSSGGSGTAGAILKGDLWTISVAGTLGGVAVTIGDVIRAKVDAPGSTLANWVITENNIGYIPENSVNKATTMTGNTTSDTKFLTAKAVYDWVTSLGYWVSVNATNLVAGISKLYNAVGTETDGGITPNAVKNGLELKIDKSEWFDFSSLSTITGFSSMTLNKINCKLVDDILHVHPNIQGVSNLATFTFTIPYVSKEPTTLFVPSGYTVNNGIALTTPARLGIATESNVVVVTRDLSGATWATSNSKAIATAIAISVYRTSVFNKGVGGNNTSDVIARLADINSVKADLAIVMIGTNDWRHPTAGNRRTPTQYKTNLATIVDSLIANGSDVLMLQFPPIEPSESDYVCPFYGEPSGCDSNATANDFRTKITEIVTEKSTLYLDLKQKFVDIGQPTALITSYFENVLNSGSADGVHPRPIGATFIAEKIAEYLNANNLTYNRIVCVGDSITAGDGLVGVGTSVDETYPAQLKLLLN